MEVAVDDRNLGEVNKEIAINLKINKESATEKFLRAYGNSTAFQNIQKLHSIRPDIFDHIISLIINY